MMNTIKSTNHSNRDTSASHNTSSSHCKRGALIKNSRFECLNEDTVRTETIPRERQSRNSNQSHYTNTSSHRYQSKIGRTVRSNRYLLLAEKNALNKKKQTLNINDGKKFPTLGNIKKAMKASIEDTIDKQNFTDIVKQTDEEIEENQRKQQRELEEKEKFRQYEGWIHLSNDNGKTVLSEITRDGKKQKIKMNNVEDDDNIHNDIYNTMTHEEFQIKCGKTMYKTLVNIQSMRDEENLILGPHSQYWEKGRLTDLTYLSDSDVESGGSDTDGKQENEYYSDCDTY